MVSAMLTAIRDFAQDSFQVGRRRRSTPSRSASCRSGSTGAACDPRCVVRGRRRPSPRYHSGGVESVHPHSAGTEGDRRRRRPFEAARLRFEAFLQSARRPRQKKSRDALGAWRSARPRAAGAGLLRGVCTDAVARPSRRAPEWSPGIVVVSAEEAGGRGRGPLAARPPARDPASHLLQLPGWPVLDVTVDGSFIRRSIRRLVVARAAAATAGARECDVRILADGVLMRLGTAPASWMADSQRLWDDGPRCATASSRCS